jgi:hypothetical protein
MQSSVLSSKRLISVGAALALLLVAHAAVAGEGHHGGHHGGGGGIGVGVGIGVGTILLNEAIRRSQERQAAEPRGCPEGLVPSRKGCVKPKGSVAKCEPPKIYRKGKGCITPKGPEVAKCDHPMVMRKGRCVSPEPAVAKCDLPKIYRKGKGCVLPPTIVVVPPPVVPEEPVEVVPAGPAPQQPPAPPLQASPTPKAPPVEPVALTEPASTRRCLPDDLYDLLEKTYGKRPALGRCPTACLPKPASYSEAELDEAEKSGVNWCTTCVHVGGYMPLPAVLKLERAANVTLCVDADMCRLPAGVLAGGGEKVTEIRTVFKDLPTGAKNDDNIAVVVGNKDYRGDLPDNPFGSADADAVMALLIDQLGYKQENIIDLRDATLEDFERVFGSDKDPTGELAGRIDKKDPGDVFIYIASHGMVKEDDAKQAYLLPVDVKLDDLDKTAYPIQELYDHLGKIGARTIMLMLEANFARNLDELIDPPNLPELEVEAMPINPVPGLAVFKASDRDQKTIKDPEYGVGLFTRYIIEGLAGRADEAPIGNDDKRIDTVELYVYTADAVRTAARKSFGLEQKPMLGKIDNLVVGTLSSN